MSVMWYHDMLINFSTILARDKAQLIYTLSMRQYRFVIGSHYSIICNKYMNSAWSGTIWHTSTDTSFFHFNPVYELSPGWNKLLSFIVQYFLTSAVMSHGWVAELVIEAFLYHYVIIIVISYSIQLFHRVVMHARSQLPVTKSYIQ